MNKGQGEWIFKKKFAASCETDICCSKVGEEGKLLIRVLEGFQVQMKNRKLSVWEILMMMMMNSSSNHHHHHHQDQSFDLSEEEEEDVHVRILILRVRVKTKALTEMKNDMSWGLKTERRKIQIPPRRLGCEMMLSALLHLELMLNMLNLSLML